MSKSTHQESWFRSVLEHCDGKLAEKPGIRDYREKDPAIYKTYLLQMVAAHCLKNGETNPRTVAKMIGYDSKLVDAELKDTPVAFFKAQWNRALAFCRNQLFESVCHQYFGGIIDGQGCSGAKMAVLNAMEKESKTVKYKYDREEHTDFPHEVFQRVGFGVVAEEDYQQAAANFRERLKVYTTLRSQRAENLTGDILADYDF